MRRYGFSAVFMRTMKHLPLLLQGGILFALCLAALAAVEEDKPYGRICFSVVQTAPETEEEVFRPGIKPGTNKQIVAYLDANTACQVLIAAFNEKDGQLTRGWMPQFLDVPMWKQVELPTPPVYWKWTEDSGPFAFFVLFLAKDSKQTSDLKQLVTAMQNAKQDAGLLVAQTLELHKRVGRCVAAHDKKKPGANEQPVLVGGVFRGTQFPWRQFCRSSNFSADDPGVLIFPSRSSSSPEGAASPPAKVK
jgi:hypothetical protein